MLSLPTKDQPRPARSATHSDAITLSTASLWTRVLIFAVTLMKQLLPTSFPAAVAISSKFRMHLVPRVARSDHSNAVHSLMTMHWALQSVQVSTPPNGSSLTAVLSLGMQYPSSSRNPILETTVAALRAAVGNGH